MSGCEEITEGCKFCYAKTLAENKRGTPAFPNGFELNIRPHKLREPINLKEPSLIFVNSMSDMFWDKVSDEYRHKIIDVMEQTPQHQYQVLTKRPLEMLRFSKIRKLPPNFWAGTTIENERNIGRLDIIRSVEAEIHFLSIEPMLSRFTTLDFSGLQWIITGGESGLHLREDSVRQRRGLADYVDGKWVPREDRIDWIRDIRDACIAHDVKFFHKQWGGVTPKSAGRLLDGRTWDEFPRYPKADQQTINNAHLVQIALPVS